MILDHERSTVTTEQVIDAVRQMKVQCDLHMTAYDSVSARSILYELGYSEEQADEVIFQLAEGGFNYCIDPMIRIKDTDGPQGDAPTKCKMVVPPGFACYWGPDQLRSRLDCAHIPALIYT